MKTPDRAKNRAIADYLRHGNVSKAARENGVDRSTLHRWIQKSAPEVQAAKVAATDEIHDEMVSLLRESMRSLRGAMRRDKKTTSAAQAAVVVGILADKAHRLTPRPAGSGEAADGEWVISVRRGGARVPTGQVDERGMVVVDGTAPANGAGEGGATS